jgi:hypothetical protein
MPEISVIVPTYNRAAFLEPCLISLCTQTIDPSRYEICVVNNACTDQTPDVVAKIAALYPHHHLFMVSEPQLGLSRARNCGLRHTSAPLVANMDDDGTVYPDWLARYLARFAEFGPELAVVGGEIEPVWGAPRPEWLAQKFLWPMTAGTELGSEPRFLKDHENTIEANGCYRRSALEAAGNYPVELGRTGSILLSGEGILEKRIYAQGGRIFFDPHILLKHHIHANRINPLWLRQRYFWQGISDFAVRQYCLTHQLPTDQAMMLNLPLDIKDWAFVGRDTAENIIDDVEKFRGLGFVLALTGIIPTENS